MKCRQSFSMRVHASISKYIWVRDTRTDMCLDCGPPWRLGFTNHFFPPEFCHPKSRYGFPRTIKNIIIIYITLVPVHVYKFSEKNIFLQAWLLQKAKTTKIHMRIACFLETNSSLRKNVFFCYGSPRVSIQFFRLLWNRVWYLHDSLGCISVLQRRNRKTWIQSWLHQSRNCKHGCQD